MYYYFLNVKFLRTYFSIAMVGVHFLAFKPLHIHKNELIRNFVFRMPFRLLNCLLFHEHLKPENLTNLKRIRIKKNCETRLNIDGYYKKEKKN